MKKQIMKKKRKNKMMVILTKKKVIVFRVSPKKNNFKIQHKLMIKANF